MTDHPTPVPQGIYVSVLRHGDLIVTSGVTPWENGILRSAGAIRTGDPLEDHRPAVELTTRNALAAVRSALKAGERIGQIMQVTVCVATAADFVDHSKVADFASALLVEELGAAGRGTRAAVGVASLPGGAPVELTVQATAIRGGGADG